MRNVCEMLSFILSFLYFITDHLSDSVLPEQDSSTVHWKLHNLLSITVCVLCRPAYCKKYTHL